MRVGDVLLNLARSDGRRSLFFVGTGKNAGKTVAMRAVAQAAAAQGLRTGLTSMGRDGEAADVIDAIAKPRLFLSPGTIVATARQALPAHPASELLDLTQYATAAGPVLIARVCRPAYYELVGPPSAAGLRACVQRLGELGCDQVVVDGAVDRVAALAGGDDAVVIAVGASDSRTMEDAIEEARALALRLRIPAYERNRPCLHVEGALTVRQAAQLAAAGDKRQIVVRDPTQIALSGRSLITLAARLDLRCERPLHVVAATIASIGRDRYFEPRAFARGVAQATGLPVFDVYAGTMVRAA